MKSTISAFLLFTVLAPLASADILTCTFTEPFLTTTYQFEDRTLTILNPFPRTVTVERDVTFRPSGNREFVLLSKTGMLLQKLKLTGKGSDGMSDKLYPFDVEWTTNHSSNGKLFGGCELSVVKI
jgi:uncharacterized membrane protein